MRGGTAMRLKGFIRKEWLQVLRDPSSIAIAFVLPLILLLIFGYGVTLDAKHIPVAVVMEHPGPQASSFAAGFRRSPYFVPVEMKSIQEARTAMRASRVDGIIWLREDFGRDVLKDASPPVSVLINGVDANTARLIEGYVQGVWIGWLSQQAAVREISLNPPVNVEQRIWFNPEVRSRNFLVPGLIAIIMTLIGALLTALVIAREWERGTMEAMMVTPITVREMLLGKLIPYFILGMGGLVLSVTMALVLFKVPLRGSVFVLFGCSSLFLLAALGMGLLISTIARTQFVAAQVAIIVTFLPAFILSGFIFDIPSMPAPIRALTHVIAARYYVSILQTVFMAGDIWTIILPNSVALLIMAVFFLGVVRRKTRKRLE